MSDLHLFHYISPPIAAISVFLLLLLSTELGYRFGGRRLKVDPEHAFSGTGPIDGAVFGLLGLLLAFTFSGAATRFEARKTMTIAEANAIGTAYLRLDLLPAAAQPDLRAAFKKYVRARITLNQSGLHSATFQDTSKDIAQLRSVIWSSAQKASQDTSNPRTAMLLLPAINEMFDIATTRAINRQIHPPDVIYAMLFGLACLGSLLAGYGLAMSKSHNWVHITSFILVLTLAIYVILDLEYPRKGLIRVDAFDEVLTQTLQEMETP